MPMNISAHVVGPTLGNRFLSNLQHDLSGISSALFH